MSRIGRKPIILPEGVKLDLKDRMVVVEGPKGSLKRDFLAGLELEINGNSVVVKRLNEDLKTKGFHGLMRTLINNMVDGVSKGFEKRLEIVGIGYRAEMQGDNVVFYLGYSHPINFTLPEGITAQVDKQTQVTVKGISKELVGEVAAKMRMLRKPDVYKNKGVKYANETLRKKAGKTGKK
ncbi:MAG TPA: 50S ribosomal protein L6 [Syntrophorhabdaceae bacterium]|jgi:large subunit ribosomal protein L6|nr:50S ribosomal protein L6 [Syntrophorhabdaceae bacterium]MDI9560686.1 50S ribosomal protein L6 [Pseudomonadota bacterium]OQC50943.1 MAG: 50S ribosomal protein L6 [Deltaproteobacteria bacterium ADurb.Bin026]MBP8699345.1 50S ribosomal protein L6 [Syntrophorhabdaceae bacterium]MBV6506019.1 50S ribosomal protein L6 [Syntrophorhabdaceae bacterium]